MKLPWYENPLFALFVFFVVAVAMLYASWDAHADTQDDELHLAAHAGASFALQTAFYGVNEKALGLDKTDSEALAFVATMATGYLYKLSENASSADTMNSMGENFAGSFAAMAMHVTFQF